MLLAEDHEEILARARVRDTAAAAAASRRRSSRATKMYTKRGDDVQQQERRGEPQRGVGVGEAA